VQTTRIPNHTQYLLLGQYSRKGSLLLPVWKEVCYVIGLPCMFFLNNQPYVLASTHIHDTISTSYPRKNTRNQKQVAQTTTTTYTLKLVGLLQGFSVSAGSIKSTIFRASQQMRLYSTSVPLSSALSGCSGRSHPLYAVCANFSKKDRADADSSVTVGLQLGQSGGSPRGSNIGERRQDDVRKTNT